MGGGWLPHQNLPGLREGAGTERGAGLHWGSGTSGEQNVVYAQWTQERIEPIAQGGVPEEVTVNHPKMAALMTEYTIEFYELATQAKLQYRGFA